MNVVGINLRCALNSMFNTLLMTTNGNACQCVECNQQRTQIELVRDEVFHELDQVIQDDLIAKRLRNSKYFIDWINDFIFFWRLCFRVIRHCNSFQEFINVLFDAAMDHQSDLRTYAYWKVYILFGHLFSVRLNYGLRRHHVGDSNNNVTRAVVNFERNVSNAFANLYRTWSWLDILTSPVYYIMLKSSIHIGRMNLWLIERKLAVV